MNHYTEELSDILSASRERDIVRDILNAWDAHGLPATFCDEGVKFAFNRNSGAVFLTNEDCQVAMLNGYKLTTWHTTPYHGHEGFVEDLLNDHSPEDLNDEDVEYLRDVANAESVVLPARWII